MEEEELTSLLMKVKQQSGKVDLKLNFKKMKIMASSPTTSWQIDGEIMETVRDFIFLGSIITADGDCSHKVKRRLLLGGKAMTNLVQFSSVQSLSHFRFFTCCSKLTTGCLTSKSFKLPFPLPIHP